LDEDGIEGMDMKKLRTCFNYWAPCVVVGFVWPVLLGLMSTPVSGDAAPLAGQIVADPAQPAWLKYHQGGPFFMCGPGDPEGFLYRGTRNSDGTRNGDQMALIDKLKETGANSIYLMAVRSHGGDGDSSQNPFIDSNPTNGLDHDILDQWEMWFTEMDAHGIVIFFIFYDDSARIWNTGSSVGGAERVFIQTLVNRFEHHKHLIWVVAEEYQESYSAARVANIAAEIHAADDHNHIVAVHKLNGLAFSEFANDPSIEQFAIQYNVSTASALHAGMVAAWTDAAGRYNLNMAEASGHGTGTAARKKNWAVAMGGAYVMVLGWSIDTTPIRDLEDCGRLRSFMEWTNVNEMAPHDDLKHGGTEYVLAQPGDSYIAYASNLFGDIGLKGMTAGTYDFTWYDITNDIMVVQTNVSLAAGDLTWSKPAGIGDELAVYIVRQDVSPSPDTIPPAAPTDLVVKGTPSPPDTTPPSVPTDLTATARSAFHIDLDWTTSTDDVGVVGYNIYRDGTLIDITMINSYADTGLTAITTYTYTVAAFDAAGNVSLPSQGTSATTLPISPGPDVVFPGSTWDSRTPAEVGLDDAKLNQFIAQVGGKGVIVKDGYMVKTWGNQTGKFDWASVSKPVISTLLFFAVAEGKLTGVDDRLLDWGWNLTPEDQTMTFRHLANNVSGYTRGEGPGEAWAYNDYAIELYAVTMENLFQQSLNDAALQRLGFLQFQDGTLFSSRGGLGMATTPRDVARIGWFWLNRGNWNGTQLLPQSYFDTFMKPQVSGDLPRTTTAATDYLGIGTYGGNSDQTPLGPGIYGFNWWFNANVGSSTTLTWPDAPVDTFQANGHWNGEVLTIIPSLGLVAAWKGSGSNPANFNQNMNNYLTTLVDAVIASDAAPQ
jgi:CubicO group peptidase (beta-lactamase class C family)